jgi:hypothetical protein
MIPKFHLDNYWGFVHVPNNCQHGCTLGQNLP